ncbi:MAG: gamma-glutamyl-gamma-aminobutyrate hydrolase family protein [Dehalococcoidia bacterium]|nr:gamma-glutamyl-gamma-aminobutyrate hydrolase family protein [Dehalococcoidia bacterium]
MPLIGISSPNEQEAERYCEAISSRGYDHIVIGPAGGKTLPEHLHGVILTGGLDIGPNIYGEDTDPEADVRISSERDEWEIPILKQALANNMPILGICRGMQLLNVVFGGKLIQDLSGHRNIEYPDDKSVFHQIYLSPGTKLAAIMGSGGFIRVNSQHHQGLGEAQKAPSLLASAYSLDDGIIEAIESPNHDWVIGVQWHNEIEEELYKTFGNIFQAFLERSDRFENNINSHS